MPAPLAELSVGGAARRSRNVSSEWLRSATRRLHRTATQNGLELADLAFTINRISLGWAGSRAELTATALALHS